VLLDLADRFPQVVPIELHAQLQQELSFFQASNFAADL
jgi:hypothetical protein